MLLAIDDPAPYEIVNEESASPFLLTCDHAGRRLPRALGDMGLPESELCRHIAWDLGIAELTRALAERLSAFAILQTYSRLVIDCNRRPGAPDSMPTLSERTEIPGNLELTPSERQAREDAIFWPYHNRISAEVERRAARPLVMVSLHSFTPSYKDVARHWHAGLLYGRDDRVARLVLPQLQHPALVLGDNEPYAFSDQTDYTMVEHAERRGLPYLELEIRQDLLAEASGVAQWSERLASALEHALPSLFSEP